MVRVLSKIRRLLIDSGLVSEQQWSSAVDAAGGPLESLLARGSVAEGDLLELLGMPFMKEEGME